MKILLRHYIAVLATCAPAVVMAGPHLVFPQDPAGEPIRETAAMFFQKIAGGDAAGAKAMFVGPPEHAALLDAELRAVAASERLNVAAEAKFGKSDAAKVVPTGALFQRLTQYERTALVIVDGDDASTAAGLVPNLGLDLHRENGRWNIVHLTIKYNQTAFPIKFYTTSAVPQLTMPARVSKREG